MVGSDGYGHSALTGGIKPYITVVITAHGRRQYLIKAIESALSQTLSHGLYEIMVVKDFSDEDIDRMIQEYGIRTLTSSECNTVGQDLAMAIEQARGEIITFLDDDDTFLPTKLERLYTLFEEDKRIVYYHNSQIMVNENGESRRVNAYSIVMDTDSLRRQIRRLIHRYGTGPLFFNMSSIAIRKAHYLGSIAVLPSLSIHPDDFFFFAGLDGDGKYFLDSLPLTVYLSHQSKGHVIRSGLSRREFLQRRAKLYRDGSDATGIIMKAVSSLRIRRFLMARQCLELLISQIYSGTVSYMCLLGMLSKIADYGLKESLLQIYLALRDLMHWGDTEPPRNP